MARFNNLSQWLIWLEKLHPNEIDLGLKRVFDVACRLGVLHSSTKNVFTGRAVNADGSYPNVVTVAGTNGKGSCVKTLESLILSNKKIFNSFSPKSSYSSLTDNIHVGSFTSPHILRYNERIKLNGIALKNIDICTLFEEIDCAREDISLTYFEFATLAAILALHRTNSPFWLLEVGLGGRLDAVNIIDCSIAIITSIGFDHQEWLGDTLDKIATEKAGIMRANTPVILASQFMPRVLDDKAECLNAPVIVQGRDYFINANCYPYYTVKTLKNNYNFSNYGLPIESLTAALIACELLELPLDIAQTQSTLDGLSLDGRFEIIRCQKTTFILDVAHNPMATERLANNLGAFKKQYSNIHVSAVCAMMADKDIINSLKPLVKSVNSWICCDIPNNKRAESATILIDRLRQLNVDAGRLARVNSVEIALASLLSKQTMQTKICLVFGSFFTVSGAKKVLSEKHN